MKDGVAAAVAGDDFVRRGGQELVNGGNGEPLFNAVAGGFVFESGNCDDVNGFGQSVVVAGDVVAAAAGEHS